MTTLWNRNVSVTDAHVGSWTCSCVGDVSAPRVQRGVNRHLGQRIHPRSEGSSGICESTHSVRQGKFASHDQHLLYSPIQMVMQVHRSTALAKRALDELSSSPRAPHNSSNLERREREFEARENDDDRAKLCRRQELRQVWYARPGSLWRNIAKSMRQRWPFIGLRASSGIMSTAILIFVVPGKAGLSAPPQVSQCLSDIDAHLPTGASASSSLRLVR